MSIPVQVTLKEWAVIRRQLVKEQEYICLDKLSYVKALLVANQLVHNGVDVKAKIVKSKENKAADVS